MVPIEDDGVVFAANLKVTGLTIVDDDLEKVAEDDTASEEMSERKSLHVEDDGMMNDCKSERKNDRVARRSNRKRSQ